MTIHPKAIALQVWDGLAEIAGPGLVSGIANQIEASPAAATAASPRKATLLPSLSLM
jgi:hypothetical protein